MVIASTLTVLLVVFLLIVDLHETAKKEVLSRFQEHQVLHALRVASQIETYLLDKSRELQMLSSIALQSGSAEHTSSDMKAYFQQMEKEYVKDISIYDERGTVTYSTDSSVKGLNFDHQGFFASARKTESRGKVSVTPLSGVKQQRGGQPDARATQGAAENLPPDYFKFLMTIPLYQTSSDTANPKGSGKFTGALSLTLDMEDFMCDHMKDPKMGSHQIWILNRDGTLLYQTEHPEMTLRNIYQRDDRCTECHISFDYVEHILREQQGVVDYAMRDHPKKLAAFASMQFENASWVIVVNTPYDEVTAFAGKSLRGHLILLCVVFLASVTGSALIFRDKRLRFKAEAEAKHWRERTSLEERIRESEARHRIMIETAHDVIWTLDTTGNFTFINKSGEAVSGYRVQELTGQHFATLVHADDLAAMEARFSQVLHGERLTYEVRGCAKNGKIFMLSVNSAPLWEQDKIIGIVSFARDITQHKQAEEALRESERQLRYLYSQLLVSQETERRRISRELHDELGQALAVLKMQVGFIEKHLREDQAQLREECAQNQQYIDEVIENVRRLSRDLSPYHLEYFGLTATLQRLIGDFTKTSPINVTFNCMNIDHLSQPEAQIALYRIVQESLTNIRKHAEATNASITIDERGDKVIFLIEDDGKGFDVKGDHMTASAGKGLGLTIIAERVRMLKGTLDIESEQGKGTRITIAVPADKRETV